MPRAVVVGAGHNGLTAGYFLAKAGYVVDIFEARAKVGGACLSTTLPCGCRVNEAANAFGMMPSFLVQELGLVERGLRVVQPDPQLVALQLAGPSIPFFTDIARTQAALAEVDDSDARAYATFASDIAVAADTLRPFSESPIATLEAFRLALDNQRPGLAQTFLFGSLRDVLSDYFSNPQVQGACAATALLYPAPTSAAGTAFALPYLALSTVNGSPGWGSVVGGIGTVSDLIADAPVAAGSSLHLSTSVRKIVVDDGTAVGIELLCGSTVHTDIVVCAIDPFVACTRLLDATVVGDHCTTILQSRSYDGGCAKLNLLLDMTVEEMLQRWPALRVGESALFAICPPLDYIDAAYADFAQGLFSSRPYLEILIPSAADPSMACGKHTPISVFALFAPFEETNASATRGRANIAGVLDRYFPGFTDRIAWSDYLSSQEIATRFGMHRGNVDHGSMTLDNIFDRRPFPRSPSAYPAVRRLSFCSAGRHPGGLVSGLPGYLAAQEILAQPR